MGDNKKIRPERVVKGLAKMVINNNSEYSEDRIKICKACPQNKKGICGLCGCILSAKTKVIEEHCPDNKWNDVKCFKEEGVVAVNMSSDKGELSLNENGFTYIYKSLNEQDNSDIILKIVNERSNYKENGLTLKGVKVRSTCGCTVATGYPKTLKDGESFDLKISYDTNRKGAFNKVIIFKANDSVIFRIKIVGFVNKKKDE